MTLSSLAAFVGLCAILALTPGPDSFLVLRCSLSNVRAGLSAAFGSSLGSIFWAGLVGIGLAALLEQSAEAYRVVKIIGGLYLIYLESAPLSTAAARKYHRNKTTVLG